MSDVLQFEQHPDADQIGAFVEHALPPHEREEMLGHLAVCKECRTIVALSLPQVETTAQPVSAPARRWWWQGWTLAWTAAVAFASLAVFAVYLHRPSAGPGSPAANQLARADQSAPQTPIGQLAVPASEQVRGDSQAQVTAKSPAPFAASTTARPKLSSKDALSAEAVEALPARSRDAASFGGTTQSSVDAAAESSTKKIKLNAAPVATLGVGLGAGNGSGIAAISSGLAGGDLQKSAPTGPAQQATIPSAPREMSAAIRAPAQSSQAVTASAPAIEAQSAKLDLNQNELQNAQLKHPLPSRLPVLSMANQTSRIVAIDTRNAVFLSKDDGRHWKAIQSQWQGRAVQAGVVDSQANDLKTDRIAVVGGLYDASARSTESMKKARSAPASSPSNAHGASLTGKVTDRTGAVIPGASIAVTEAATHAVRTVTTDATGLYAVNGLAPGKYQVTAQARGFEREELAAVAVTAGRPAVANLSLKMGVESQTVAVQADALAESASDRRPAKRVATNQLPSLFEITTEDGERWTSADGVSWTHSDLPPQR